MVAACMLDYSLHGMKRRAPAAPLPSRRRPRPPPASVAGWLAANTPPKTRQTAPGALPPPPPRAHTRLNAPPHSAAGSPSAAPWQAPRPSEGRPRTWANGGREGDEEKSTTAQWPALVRRFGGGCSCVAPHVWQQRSTLCRQWTLVSLLSHGWLCRQATQPRPASPRFAPPAQPPPHTSQPLAQYPRPLPPPSPRPLALRCAGVSRVGPK